MTLTVTVGDTVTVWSCVGVGVGDSFGVDVVVLV